ncbi:hypothetical protein BVC80_1803g16 [Macleaya cordata]|uniref:Uncharacterized protein n=1 Tax=Macleaya cordata TaxID=56857 RepID=A0A200QR09_MACCD|nr:hypothetical protein BVC80_1803g16 [Macleaya cordata]
MDDYRDGSSPLKHKRKPTLCLSCCFGSNNRSHETLESPSSDDSKPRLTLRSPTSWLKSRTHHFHLPNHNHHEFPEFKEKCKNLFCKIGKGRRHSVDFRHDPLSYALNFDEGISDENLADEFPLRNFSARLPPSPQIPSPGKSVSSSVMVPREIAAYS